MKVHLLGITFLRLNGDYVRRTACGKNVTDKKTKTVLQLQNVTCEMCLKHKFVRGGV